MSLHTIGQIPTSQSALPKPTQRKSGQPPSHATGMQPRFGSSGPVPVHRFLEHVDFTAVGASPVKQIALVFSSLIAWRLLAANERRRASVSKRWNEMRENLMRDLLGFAFWFLGVPVLQRFYLGAVARRNPALKNILIQHVPPDTAGSQGLWGWIKSNNPLNNRYIPSSQQVKDQMSQALHTLQEAGFGPGHTAYDQTQKNYLQLIKHRNFATAVGLGSTILLLGVGINLLNFYLTRRNMARSQKEAPAYNPAVSPYAGRYTGRYPARIGMSAFTAIPATGFNHQTTAPAFGKPLVFAAPSPFQQRFAAVDPQHPFAWPVAPLR